MDRLRSLKGRIGEAFVESILRRAGYKVSRIGRESQVQQMLRTGISEFLPDFLIWKQVDRTGGDASLNRVLSVEVKYRYDIPDFLQRYGGEFLLDVAEHWPDLYVILVTDNPEPTRSCFQAIDLRGYRPDAPLTTADLHDLPSSTSTGARWRNTRGWSSRSSLCSEVMRAALSCPRSRPPRCPRSPGPSASRRSRRPGRSSRCSGQARAEQSQRHAQDHAGGPYPDELRLQHGQPSRREKPRDPDRRHFDDLVGGEVPLAGERPQERDAEPAVGEGVENPVRSGRCQDEEKGARKSGAKRSMTAATHQSRSQRERERVGESPMAEGRSVLNAEGKGQDVDVGQDRGGHPGRQQPS